MGDDEERLLEQARESREKTQELREESGLEEEADQPDEAENDE